MSRSQAGRPRSLLAIVSRRIAVTNVSELPLIIPELVSLLHRCPPTAFETVAEKNARASDAIVLAHTHRTQISTLLQDKTAAGRWAGVVLVKATIEAAGPSQLISFTPWFRTILALITRPEPWTTRRLAIMTLTRVFLLTQGRTQTTREVTTPLLGPFVSACLSVMSKSDVSNSAKVLRSDCPILETILQSYIRLVPQHPTSFRPFISQLHALLVEIIRPSGRNGKQPLAKDPVMVYESRVKHLARRLIALLPVTAPKNGAGDVWSSTMDQLLRGGNTILDHIMSLVTGEQPEAENSYFSGQKLSDSQDKTRALLQFDQSVDANDDHHVALQLLNENLRLCQALLATALPFEVTIPVAQLSAMLERVLSMNEVELTARRETDRHAFSGSKHEQSLLLASVPSTHALTLHVFATVVARIGLGSNFFASDLLRRTERVLIDGRDEPELRKAAYDLLERLLHISGPGVSQEISAAISLIVKSACDDILPAADSAKAAFKDPKQASKEDAQRRKPKYDADSFVTAARRIDTSFQAPLLASSARKVMESVLRYIPAEVIDSEARRRVDRAAVQLQDRNLLVASVLNPPTNAKGKHGASLLPFLARAHADATETEAILRPRMPVVPSGETASHRFDEQEYETTHDRGSSIRMDDAEEADRPYDTSAALYADPKLATWPSRPRPDIEANSHSPNLSTPLATQPDPSTGSLQDMSSKRSLQTFMEAATVNKTDALPAHQTWKPDLEPASKRARFETGEPSTLTSRNGATATAIETSSADLTRPAAESAPVQAQHPISAPLAAKGDDGSSSDSEIPTLDPTLASGFSEDDESESEEGEAEAI